MPRKQGSANGKGVSDEDRHLIERFEAAYNGIDAYLCKFVKRDQDKSFGSALTAYQNTRESFDETANYLRKVVAFRNELVHSKVQPYQYFAVPTLTTVERMEGILRGLKSPKLAIPTFKTEVETISLKNSLEHALRRISATKFSQFPVYLDTVFKGLLTENGITLWMANRIMAKSDMGDLEKVTVERVMREEERRRQSFIFVPPDKHVDDIIGLFASSDLLESVLITDTGNNRGKLKGIATRWDIVRIKHEDNAKQKR